MTQLTGSQLVGLTFIAPEVTQGPATLNPDGSFTYTVANQVSAFAPFGGTATIDSANGDVLSVTLHGGFVNGVHLTGTLVGNDGSDFLLHGTVPLLGTGYVYVTNSFAGQPPVGGKATIKPLDPGNTYTAPACFAAGTRIATDAGPVAVEALGAGMQARLADGGLAEIVWVGRRTLDCRRHIDPATVHPVRITAGAFAPGQPAADLLLSPEHCVFAGGALIPVKCLLNGATIRQETVATVTYYHVELALHDVVLAEGLPVESYLDAGNRSAFEEGAAFLQLHPDFTPRSVADACAPVVTSGPVLTAVRQRLLGRAGSAFGYVPAQDSGLAVLADGRECYALVEGNRHAFAVPPGAQDVRIVSNSGVPALMESEFGDRRRLGVAIGAIRVAGQALPLTHGGLGAGFHPVEQDGAVWRWTDGEAVLSPALFDPAQMTALELWVSAVQPSWTQDVSVAKARVNEPA